MRKFFEVLMEENKDGKGAGGGVATFDTLIPAEFKDKAYLADVKTLPVGPEAYSALFKKLDGAQTLIGKKAGAMPPAADAPAEEVEKFYGTLRPAKPEEYEFAPPPEGQTVDEDFLKATKGMFHEAGLSKVQAAKLVAKFDKYVAEKTAPQIAEAQKLDKEFTEMSTKAFGAENSKVMERSKELLKTLCPPTMSPFLNRLPNESLVLLAGIMEEVRAKFMGEDKMGGGTGGSGSAPDINALKEEMYKIIASPAWKDYKDSGHDTAKARVSAISAALSKAGVKQ
jgi:hypothetical protein